MKQNDMKPDIIFNARVDYLFRKLFKFRDFILLFIFLNMLIDLSLSQFLLSMWRLILSKFRVLCRQSILYRVLLGASFITVMLIITVLAKLNDTTAAKKCFRYKPNDHLGSEIAYFQDIVESKKQPKDGKNIFFHETSCSWSGVITLNAR